MRSGTYPNFLASLFLIATCPFGVDAPLAVLAPSASVTVLDPGLDGSSHREMVGVGVLTTAGSSLGVYFGSSSASFVTGVGVGNGDKRLGYRPNHGEPEPYTPQEVC